MKNRTILGLICMVLAVAITFAISPLMNRLTDGEKTVIRLSSDIKQGAEITKDDIETVKVKESTLPQAVLNNSKDIVGKYAAANLFAGDYLTKKKLNNKANTADDVFSGLDGSKVAISFTINNFAAGLSGKLYNGDIISILVCDETEETATIPPELKYVQVITTTTQNGIDKDAVTKKEDGTIELPSTIIVLVNSTQAKLIAKYESETTMQVALVYHGEKETAQQFLDKQEAYFKGGA